MGQAALIGVTRRAVPRPHFRGDGFQRHIHDGVRQRGQFRGNLGQRGDSQDVPQQDAQQLPAAETGERDRGGPLPDHLLRQTFPQFLEGITVLDSLNRGEEPGGIPQQLLGKKPAVSECFQQRPEGGGRILREELRIPPGKTLQEGGGLFPVRRPAQQQFDLLAAFSQSGQTQIDILQHAQAYVASPVL